MTELPPELQHIGLGARTFKKRSGPENKDRSIWTDTPADRERKARVSSFDRARSPSHGMGCSLFKLLLFLIMSQSCCITSAKMMVNNRIQILSSTIRGTTPLHKSPYGLEMGSYS